jgi:hypothetical protein
MTVSIAGYPLRIRRQVAFGEPDWSVELHSNYVRAIHCARSSIMQAPVAPACQCGSKMVCSCTLHVARLSYRLGRRAQSTLNGPIPNNGHYLLVPLQRGIRLFFLSSHADRMRIKALVCRGPDRYVRRQLHFARGTGSSLA